MNISPLLQTLSKLSGGRILADAAREQEGDLHRAVIPLVGLNTGPEREDPTLRAYAKDWVVLQSVAPVRASCTFEVFPSPRTWRYDDGTVETRQAIAAITLSWWPKPREPERPRRRDEESEDVSRTT